MKPHHESSISRRVRRVCLIGLLSMTAGSWACNEPVSPRNPSAPSPAVPPAPSGAFPPPPGTPLSGPTGSFAVTLTASPSCATVTDSVSGGSLPFPDSVRVRQYDGEFANGEGKLTAMDGTGNRVPLGGIDRYLYYGLPLMYERDGTLTIFVPGYYGSDRGRQPTCTGGDYWWEDFGEKEVFELCGTWTGSTANPTQIDGTIEGAFAYYKGPGPNHTTNLFCRATDHHFTMTRK
jgi:hypothetical protein